MDRQLNRRLKYEHRVNMVQIGIRALEHALRLIPKSPEHKTATKYIELIQQGRSEEISALVQQHQKQRRAIVNKEVEPRPYTAETCLVLAAEELLRLSVSEKYISGVMLNDVFVYCWNGASCIGKREQQIEMDYENTALHPQIKIAFENLRTQEKLLRTA